MILLLTTFPSAASARRVSGQLVLGRFAACATMLPARSVYWWKGRVENTSEAIVLFKTTRSRKEALKRELRSRHPYEVPEVLEIDVADVNSDYAAWLTSVVDPKRSKKGRKGRS